MNKKVIVDRVLLLESWSGLNAFGGEATKDTQDKIQKVLTEDNQFRYEYTTIQFPFDQMNFNHPANEPSEKDGWKRVWADVDLSGVFAVYRREVKKEK